MEVNYLGSVYCSQAVVSGMKQRKQGTSSSILCIIHMKPFSHFMSGRIIFTSSQAGQLGLYGYTAYCASKFALRGLAEALQMEV